MALLYADNPEAAREAAYLNARLIAHDLASLGINVDCLPVLDVPVPGAHDIIGDRAFATDPATIIALGKAQIEGLMDGGVLPVMKHIPAMAGQGRTAIWRCRACRPAPKSFRPAILSPSAALTNVRSP